MLCCTVVSSRREFVIEKKNNMAEDVVAPLELREKGAPLHEGKSPTSHSPAQVEKLQSSSISVNKASPSSAECYWFAQTGDSPSETRQPPEKEKDGIDQDGKDAHSGKDREERVRILREKQAEERQRKLEELKSAAMQAQKFREIQEEERRRKIEEIKHKDFERRLQVEERKKQIWEAEKERRETILRKSQEREAKIEAARNAQRSSIGFAFGSCTPRLLDMEPSIMTGRRSTSQTNVTLIPTTNSNNNGGRATASEQGDEDVVKRRITSAFSLDHRKRDAAQRHTIHEAFSWENSWHSVVANHDSSESPNPSDPNTYPSPPHQRKFQGHSLNFPWDTDSGVQQTPMFPTTPWGADQRLSGVLTGSGVLVGENLMTTSLTSLTSSLHRGRRKTDLIPTVPPARDSPRTRSPAAPSPSRPQSSLSQMSLSSHTSQNSSVSLRARSAPRKQRPLSVAGSIPDKPGATEDRRGRSSEKKAAPLPTGKPPRAKSAGADQAAKEVDDALQKSTTSVASPVQRRGTSLSASSTPAPKGSTPVAKDKPKIAPKPTVHKEKYKPSPAIQANGSEQKPITNSRESTPPRQITDESNSGISSQVTKMSESTKTIAAVTIDSATTRSSEPLTVKMVPVEFEDQPLIDSLEILPAKEAEKPPPTESPALVQNEIVIPAGEQYREPEVIAPAMVPQESDDIASKVEMVSEPTINASSTQPQLGESAISDVSTAPTKLRITTEEEAKAAIAEKRRLAREQAEREAELERQRQEELRRQEEERLRREEEEQRLWEEEQEKARLLEQERLKKAIEEQQQREEEEKRRKEEEAKQKVEKEIAERIAREEQEKLRKEAEEKLRKEEEERAERRKRVEAIMSRTRGKGGTNTPPVTTPTKSVEPVVALTEQKELIQSSKPISDSASQNSKEDGLTENLQNQMPATQPDLLGNIAKGESQQTLLEQQSVIKIESKEENGVEPIHTNGFAHHKIVDSQLDVDLIMDRQSTPEKKTSPLMDTLVEFDMLAPKLEPTPMSDVAPLIDLSLNTLHHSSTDPEITTTTSTTLNELERISNEDNVNFNITTTNGLGNPFVDNYSKHQESVTDYLA